MLEDGVQCLGPEVSEAQALKRPKGITEYKKAPGMVLMPVPA